MAGNITRRDMIRSSALSGALFWLGTRAGRVDAYAANEKLGLAFIGIGGRGRANLNSLGGENVIALCDVHDERAGDAYKKFPAAKKFYDYRPMLESLDKEIDGVVISTPDHTHFHPASTALEMGKHLYLEKPMAHNVHEVRTLTQLAAQKKVATQLGVQRHTIENVHRVVELVKAGAIGEVRECHSWVGGDRGMPGMPKEPEAVPGDLKWDLWLGPVAERPYSKSYAPYGWRFFWDFGTGETGNWGCHILDIPFWALNLKYPTRVEGSGPEVDPQMTPKSLATRFEFPARGQLPPVTLHWYHTKDGPAVLKENNLPHWGSGTLFVGSKGMLLCEFGKRQLFPEAKFKDFEAPPKSIPDSPGFYKEWVTACKGGEPATCRFDYSGPMTETVLLGNVAYRCGSSFDWDSKNLIAKGAPEAANYIREEYREGWKL